ncbi:MAG: hypothetical protein ACXWQ5_04705 [Ktedonobacterales bacterium]
MPQDNQEDDVLHALFPTPGSPAPAQDDAMEHQCYLDHEDVHQIKSQEQQHQPYNQASLAGRIAP